MPQDLQHSILFELCIIHDKNQINQHKSTRITSLLADINDAKQYDGSPKQIQTISPHLSYSHYTNSNSNSNDEHTPILLLRSMTIGDVMSSNSKT